MADKKSRLALGRGLSNLIPVDNEEFTNLEGYREIQKDSLQVNPFQSRYDFNDEDIKGLAESIKNQGLLQPIVVREMNDGYEIISGERRFRALQFLGRTALPCIVKKDVTDNNMREMALVENIQRENLNEIEIALAYKNLLFECGLSHQELSERVGKSRSAITNSLRLLKLPEEIQKMVRTKEISMGHARALLSLKTTEEQCSIAAKIKTERLSVRDIENWYQNESEKNLPKNVPKKPLSLQKRPTSTDPDLEYQEEQLRYHFGTEVNISMNDKNIGKIEIAYYNKSDLDRILNIILL